MVHNAGRRTGRECGYGDNPGEGAPKPGGGKSNLEPIHILSCINRPGSKSRDSQKLKTELERSSVLIPRIARVISSMYQVLHARHRHIIYLEVFGNGPDVNLGTKRKVFLQLTKIESFVVVHTNAFFQNRAKNQPPISLHWSPRRMVKSRKVTNRLITNKLFAHAREKFDILWLVHVRVCAHHSSIVPYPSQVTKLRPEKKREAERESES